jgi:hypothetical protein
VKDGGIADDVKLASKGAEANRSGVDLIDAKRLKNDLDAVVVQVSYRIVVYISLTTTFLCHRTYPSLNWPLFLIRSS